MSRRFLQFLGPTLKAKIEELTSEPHHDQINLYDEIAIARLAAVQALKLAEPVLNGSIKVDANVTALALGCLRDAMDHVRDVVCSAAKIEAAAGGKVSLRVIDLIVIQIVKAIHEVCPDIELANKIEKQIRETVHIPNEDSPVNGVIAVGVESTPEIMVMEMDQSVCGL